MKELIINREWLFKFGENQGDETRELFEGYQEIGLPHSFGIPYYGENNFYVGYGCYQKTIILNESQLSEKIFLEFGAVFQVAEIYINGRFVMKHEGGYTAFLCEITDFSVNGENKIFVRVNNHWSPTIAPRAGEHTFNGGIYRDVKLLCSNKAHIAWYGIFVRSKKISDEEAELTIDVETENCEGLPVCSEIFDADNTLIATVVTIAGKTMSTQKVRVKNPKLWDVERPNLYRLETTVAEDRASTSFGIRYIVWDAQKGFFLNGKRVLLCGANVHQDHGGWGDAVTHTGVRRDIKIMKECGFNFIRGSHYPHHAEFAKECDSAGMLFWSESVFWGIGGFTKDGYWDCSAMPTEKEYFSPFEDSLKQSLIEMIRTNRNSPSIICWSIGNEIFFSEPKVLCAAREMAGRLVEFSHNFDGSRPAAIGGVQRGGFDTIGDIAGYNGDGAVLFKNPVKPNMVAEYGSIASYRPGNYDLYETKGSDEYYSWRAGRAIWCGFHHGSIAGIGNLGIVDLYRLPLKAWYAYREKQRGIAPPSFATRGTAHHLVLTSDRDNFANDGTEDCFLVTSVYDVNGKRVSFECEICLEVVSGGGLLPTGKKMIFSRQQKNCFDGACAIEMRGYYAGKTVVRATSAGLAASEVEIEILGDEKYNGQVLAYPIAPKQINNRCCNDIDIIKDRPSSVSSERVEGNSLALTSDSSHKFWSPSKKDSNPSVLLDLEHCYPQCEITIEKLLLAKFTATTYSSIDRENWTKLGKFSCKRFQLQQKIKAASEMRYIKIIFDEGKSIKLKRIRIYSK